MFWSALPKISEEDGFRCVIAFMKQNMVCLQRLQRIGLHAG